MAQRILRETWPRLTALERLHLMLALRAVRPAVAAELLLHPGREPSIAAAPLLPHTELPHEELLIPSQS